MAPIDLQTKIGETAGMIYTAFVGKGVFDSVKLKKTCTNADDNLINMAVGWLSRENKIYVKLDVKRLLFEIKS